MRNVLLRVAVLLLALGCCWLLFLMGKRTMLARVAASAAAQTFVIQMHETMVVDAESGSHTHNRDFFYAQRTDGSRAFGNFVLGPKGSWKILARKLNLVPERQVVRIFDNAKAKSSYTMTDTALEKLVGDAKPATCLRYPPYQFSGSGSFLGYRVMKFDLRAGTSNGDQEQETAWLAPDLACHAIYAQLTIKNAEGATKVVTTQKAVSIYRGTPPAELFTVDSSYAEVPPSELHLRGIAAETGSRPVPDAALQKRLDTLDAAYKQRHAAR